jgi:hypothetical protein
VVGQNFRRTLRIRKAHQSEEQKLDRRDSIKLMIAATGSILLPAGEVAQALPMWNQSSQSTGSQFTPLPKVYVVQPAFTQLKFGDIRPAGWILAQMCRDLQTGFAGHLDELCHETSSDIFASGRNRPGNPNNGEMPPVTAWWNGESEGNWRCGHFMLACLDASILQSMAKAQRICESHPCFAGC